MNDLFDTNNPRLPIEYIVTILHTLLFTLTLLLIKEEMSDQGNGSPRFVMLRNLTHKLVYRPKGISELYDLKSDPKELNNLYNDPNKDILKAEMKKRMLNWLVETGDVPVLRQDRRGPPKYPAPIAGCQDVLQPDPKQKGGDVRGDPNSHFIVSELM
mmetsp:Transcript_25521/g.31368  ORF Transcript_25521/g.31368 Transcript_25521/m.31368 type:complete len:157 (-) Transcript_25521:838-1308(-)